MLSEWKTLISGRYLPQQVYQEQLIFSNSNSTSQYVHIRAQIHLHKEVHLPDLPECLLMNAWQSEGHHKCIQFFFIFFKRGYLHL